MSTKKPYSIFFLIWNPFFSLSYSSFFPLFVLPNPFQKKTNSQIILTLLHILSQLMIWLFEWFIFWTVVNAWVVFIDCFAGRETDFFFWKSFFFLLIYPFWGFDELSLFVDTIDFSLFDFFLNILTCCCLLNWIELEDDSKSWRKLFEVKSIDSL